MSFDVYILRRIQIEVHTKRREMMVRLNIVRNEVVDYEEEDVDGVG